jgi:hypothetical protein
MSTASLFDPQSFLDATTTEANVKRPPIPAGTELVGVILKIASRAWQGKKDPTTGGIVIDVTVEFDLDAAAPNIKQLVGLDKVTIQDGIMLDLTDSGSIDYSPGKNSKLRRYREALGLNVPGQSFAARMMEGRTVRCKIKNEPYEGDIFDKIDSVAKV